MADDCESARLLIAGAFGGAMDERAKRCDLGAAAAAGVGDEIPVGPQHDHDRGFEAFAVVPDDRAHRRAVELRLEKELADGVVSRHQACTRDEPGHALIDQAMKEARALIEIFIDAGKRVFPVEACQKDVGRSLKQRDKTDDQQNHPCAEMPEAEPVKNGRRGRGKRGRGERPERGRCHLYPLPAASGALRIRRSGRSVSVMT